MSLDKSIKVALVELENFLVNLPLTQSEHSKLLETLLQSISFHVASSDITVAFSKKPTGKETTLCKPKKTMHKLYMDGRQKPIHTELLFKIDSTLYFVDFEKYNPENKTSLEEYFKLAENYNNTSFVYLFISPTSEKDISKLGSLLREDICYDSSFTKLLSEVRIALENNDIDLGNVQLPIAVPTSFVKMNALKPLYKWSGGKRDELKSYWDYYPRDFKVFVEPFFGGGADFFHLEYPENIISDVHKESINLLVQLKEGYGDSILEIFKNKCKFTEEEYYQVRDRKHPFSDTDSITEAFRFFYLRKTCFRGMSRYSGSGENLKFNIPWGRYNLDPKKAEHSIDKAELLVQNCNVLSDPRYKSLLGNTVINNLSFENIFEQFNDERYFFFLDPPYDSTFTDYGYCEFGRKNHEKLRDYFISTKSKCLLVIGCTPFIYNLYSGGNENGSYIKAFYQKSYKFKLLKGRIDASEINKKHLIITNYSDYRIKTT